MFKYIWNHKQKLLCVLAEDTPVFFSLLFFNKLNLQNIRG